MKAKAIKTFKDLKAKKVIEKGEVFNTVKKRLEEINSTSFGILAREIKEKKENKNEQSN